MLLSDYTANIIENLACRAAQAAGGTITPHHLLPYLPVSLGIIEHCLTAMLDDASITSSVEDGITVTSFSAYSSATASAIPQLLAFKTCIACDADYATETSHAICSNCDSTLRKELNTLAKTMAWPAQAVYEHEILYNAAKENKPMYPAELAANSRFTLRSMRRKLDLLAKGRYTSKEQHPAKGIATYAFPAINYPRNHYQENMTTILTYPASIMEEMQTKLTRILMTLGLMLVVMLGMAFWGFPFPFLMMLFFIIGPITALLIWRHKSSPDDD
jgi:hypothetical protein